MSGVLTGADAVMMIIVTIEVNEDHPRLAARAIDDIVPPCEEAPVGFVQCV